MTSIEKEPLSVDMSNPRRQMIIFHMQGFVFFIKIVNRSSDFDQDEKKQPWISGDCLVCRYKIKTRQHKS